MYSGRQRTRQRHQDITEETESTATIDIKEKGTTIVLVEHNMKLVMDVADEIIVLEFGQKLAEGNCDEICCDQKVIEAYLGSDYTNPTGRVSA